jgi:hypothetical protein
MISNRICAFALLAFAIIGSAPLAIAAQFDGHWRMVAITTSGHCGEIPIDVGISSGRIYSTGGSYFRSLSNSIGRARFRSGAGQDECSGWPTHRPKGPEGSVGFGAAGLGPVPGPLVPALAFGVRFAPNAPPCHQVAANSVISARSKSIITASVLSAALNAIGGLGAGGSGQLNCLETTWRR